MHLAKNRKARYEDSTLTAEQLRTFLEVAKGDGLEALYTLVMSTGMRSGEVLALRWRDVDLSSGTVHVRSTLQRLHGEFNSSDPKTAGSRRQVTLTDLAIAALKEHR